MLKDLDDSEGPSHVVGLFSAPPVAGGVVTDDVVAIVEHVVGGGRRLPFELLRVDLDFEQGQLAPGDRCEVLARRYFG